YAVPTSGGFTLAQGTTLRRCNSFSHMLGPGRRLDHSKSAIPACETDVRHVGAQVPLLPGHAWSGGRESGPPCRLRCSTFVRSAPGPRWKETNTAAELSRTSAPATGAERSTMRAVVYQKPFEVAVDKVDAPKIQAPTDALVRITTTCICGSDLDMYEGRTDAQPGIVFG